MRSSMNMFCVVCSLAILSLCAGIASATTIYVDGSNTSGPWDGTIDHPYQHIQDGVDAAITGDTVYVFNGTYYEDVAVDRSVNLTGQSRDGTTVNAGGSGTGISITTDEVRVHGFTIRDADKGISINSSYNTVSGNFVTDNNVFGIHLVKDSYDNIIINNEVTNSNHTGIMLYYSYNNNIITNSVANSTRKGIHLSGSYDNNITGNTVTESGDGSICLGYFYASNSNTVSGNTIADGGIIIRYSSNETVIDNILSSDGITIEGNYLNQWNTHIIENNYINGKPIYYYKNAHRVVVPSDGGQVILANCSNFVVQDLNLNDAGRCIQLGFSTLNDIQGNSITNSNGGILLNCSPNNNIAGNDLQYNGNAIATDGYSDDNTITGNSINDNSCGIGWVGGASGNTVIENIITRNYYGIRLFYGGSNHVISDNIIIDNNDCGIYLCEVLNSTITGNVIRSNGGDGIRLAHLLYFQPYNNTISGNNIEDNEGHGISLYLTHDNVISWNQITGNARSGIYHDLSCDNNVIFKNHIANNVETGIYLESSSNDNTMYHNNFISNNPNAYDEGTNIWDDGYPSGGNYWDDYVGSDNFSGPEQNIPGSDGIGDTPHDIPGGSNHDGYPLMAAYSVLFVRGDANADMKIQMGDATNILLYLYVPGSPALVCMDAGDANDDGAITMNDALYILHYLYVPGSPEPQAPFPGCGMDQTEDELVCLSYPPCE